MKAIGCFKLVLSKKIDDKTAEITDALIICHGELRELVQTKDDIRMHWSKNGDWSYKTSNTLVSFDKDTKKTTVSIICEPETTEKDINIASIAYHAESAIKDVIDNIVIP
jgi:hypothetical protein